MGMGYSVCSAGTMGLAGAQASAGAIMACAERGIDLSHHRSSMLTGPLLQESDLIFVMERAHLDQVLSIRPEAADHCWPLDPDGDIADPVGQSEAHYRQCCARIEQAIRHRMSELVL